MAPRQLKHNMYMYIKQCVVNINNIVNNKQLNVLNTYQTINVSLLIIKIGLVM